MSSQVKHSSHLLKYVTEVNNEVFSFSWKIEKLNSFPQGIIFQSPLFSSSKDKEKRTWRLGISYDGVYLRFFPSLIYSRIMNTNVYINIEVLNNKGKRISQNTNIWQSVCIGTEIGGIVIPRHPHLQIEEAITVICKTNIMDCKLKSTERTVPCSPFGETLLLSKKHSDVVFIIDGKEFKAHKAMLAAASSVFDAMFSHKMKETMNNKVEIEDFSYNTFEKAMEYIYTGVLKDVDDVFLDLIEFSDKYGLLSLKALCEESMYNHVNIENVIDVLIFADKHSAEHLRTYAKNVMKTMKSEVSKTSGWKKLESKPHLLMELWAASF